MALRDKLRAEAERFLDPGERIDAVFGAQGVDPMWSILSPWFIVLRDAYRAVVVTDRRILVVRTSRWRWTKFRTLERTMPRATVLGEPTGLFWRTEVFGERLWIHRRFHGDVRDVTH